MPRQRRAKPVDVSVAMQQNLGNIGKRFKFMKKRLDTAEDGFPF